MVHEYAHNLEHQGITLELFYQYTNSDEKALREQMRNDATKRVKYRFMLEEIANIEKVEVTDKEANEEAKSLAEKYNTNVDDFLKQIGGIEALKYDMKMEKVFEIMKK